MPSFDVAVVGGGVMGLSTAWFLAQEGVDVLLLDQLPFPTSRNSSCGHSRIFRAAYSQPEFAALMRAALPLWRDLEARIGEALLLPCGLLYGGRRGVAERVARSLQAADCPFRRLSAGEVHARWPQLSGFPPEHDFVLDDSAGCLAADRAMQGLHRLLQAHPRCTLRFKEKVTAVVPQEGRVRIATTGGVFEARAAVLTAGAWSADVLRGLDCFLPLEAQSVAVAYFKVLEEPGEAFKPAKLPTIVYETDGNVYVLPEVEYPGYIKVGNHEGRAQHPDFRDRFPREELVQPMSDFVKRHLQGVDPRPAIVEHCIYTRTPDDFYVLDRHPRFDNVVIGAGFCGHGFKMAPAVGRILGSLALDAEVGFDLTAFRIARFDKSAKL